MIFMERRHDRSPTSVERRIQTGLFASHDRFTTFLSESAASTRTTTPLTRGFPEGIDDWRRRSSVARHMLLGQYQQKHRTLIPAARSAWSAVISGDAGRDEAVARMRSAGGVRARWNR
jgi:hypothetical protein